LALIISDLLDEAPLRPALVALRAKGFDASFLQVMSEEDLSPAADRWQLIDAESGTKLAVSPEEVTLYRERVRHFVEVCRGTILQAGFRHALLTMPETTPESNGQTDASHMLERRAFAALIQEGMLVKR
jgi:hypothetical protein